MEIYTQASGWSSVTYGVMRVTETGWDSEAVQSWMVKYTGNYRNNLVWADFGASVVPPTLGPFSPIHRLKTPSNAILSPFLWRFTISPALEQWE